MTARRLLILHDSPLFGGHEIIFLRLFPALLESAAIGRIIFCFPEANERLAKELAALASPKLELRPWPFEKKRAEPYLAGFRWRYRAAVRRIHAEVAPDITLLVQGRIENLATPLLALPRDAHVVSYIPMAHGMAAIGRKGALGDRVRRRLYARLDALIVPSRAVEAQARAAGATRAPVMIVENVVDPPAPMERTAARAALDLPAEARIALFLGRLDTDQKGLDLLAAAIRRASFQPDEWRFVFAGDGPGRAVIEQVRGVPVTLLGWTDKPHVAMAAADVLLMPSRWEGVPLAMLEAMHAGLPILASDIDVFRDYLPAEALIDFANADIAPVMRRLVTPEAVATYRAHVARRLTDSTLDRSREAFLQGVLA